MATMADFLTQLNAGLGNLTSTPLGQFGVQMLGNSGYDPNNAGLGQRLGRSFAGMADMQQAQAQTNAQVQMRNIQAMQAMMEAQKLKREQEAADNTTNFFKENPDAIPGVAGRLGAAGAPITAVSGIMKAEMGGQPTRQGIFNRQNPDNTVTQMIWNPVTKAYDEGATSVPVNQQQVNATVQNNQAMQQYHSGQLAVQQANADIAQQQAETARQRAAIDKQQADRQNIEFLQKNNIAKATLESGYNGVRTQMQQQKDAVQAILNDKGFDRAFGWTGAAPTAPGSDAARIEALLDNIRANAGMSGLVQLEQQGIKLTPVSDNDFTNAIKSKLAVTNRMSANDARMMLKRYQEGLDATMASAADRYNVMSRAYETPQAQQAPQQQQGATIVRTGRDAQGRKVVQYSDGRIEYGN